MYSHIELSRLQDISIYIHVPFCRSKCAYCSFYSSQPKNEKEVSHYFFCIQNEIEAFFEKSSIPVRTVYIGGGSPDIYGLENLAQFCNTILNILPNTPIEWTVECNPEGITTQGIHALQSSPVTRLSIGIQSFNSSLLSLLERKAGIETIEKANAIIKKYWDKELNIDLLYGIPRQTLDMVNYDLDMLNGINPKHVSAYELTPEKNTILMQALITGKLTLPDEETILQMYRTVKQSLKSLDIIQYEISNYARPGKECLHNQRYWKMRPYAGFGQAAVSTLPGENNSVLRIKGRQNYNNMGLNNGYVNDKAYSTETVSGIDFLFEYCLMSLRTNEGINISQFHYHFGFNFENTFYHLLNRWYKSELAEKNKNCISLTEKGLLIQNTLLTELLEEIETSNELIQINWP